jgi:hypothetical protein
VRLFGQLPDRDHPEFGATNSCFFSGELKGHSGCCRPIHSYYNDSHCASPRQIIDGISDSLNETIPGAVKRLTEAGRQPRYVRHPAS